MISALYTVRRTERVAWAVAVVALAGDVLITAYGLEHGYVESNQIAVALFQHVGVPATFALLKGFALVVAIAAWKVLPTEYRIVAPACLATPWVFAVVWNVALLTNATVAA